MFGYYDDSGYGRGMGRVGGFGRGGGLGLRRCRVFGFGRDMGSRFRLFGPAVFGQSEIEVLKRHRDRLEFHKNEIEVEIKSVDEKIKSLEK